MVCNDVLCIYEVSGDKLRCSLRVSCAGVLKAEETQRNNGEFVRRTPDLVKVISLEQSGGSDYPLE